MSEISNPLLSSSPHAWGRLVEAVEPAALLLVIEQRMGPLLRASLAPEDILQDALLHAWRDRSQVEWRGIRSFRAWLLGIIDHRLHDEADRLAAAKRGGGRAAGRLDDAGTSASSSGGFDFPAASTTPSRLAMYREQAEAMRQALEGLPGELRAVVQLRIFEQVELAEIAARLGLGVSGVRHRFRKGSELYASRLRAALGSRGAGGESAAAAPRESSP